MILCVSVLSVVISPFSFLILLIWFLHNILEDTSLNLPANAEDVGDSDSIPELGKSHAVGNGNLVFVLGKFQRSLAGYCPCGCKELDTTEWLSMHDAASKWQSSIQVQAGHILKTMFLSNLTRETIARGSQSWTLAWLRQLDLESARCEFKSQFQHILAGVWTLTNSLTHLVLSSPQKMGDYTQSQSQVKSLNPSRQIAMILHQNINEGEMR